MSFTALAKNILQNAEILDKYIATTNIPPPSTSADGPPFLKFKGDEACGALATLLFNTHKLSHLAQGPASTWLGTMFGAAGDAMTTAAVYQFNIVDHVPLERAVPFQEVAAACGMADRDFGILVRYAMTNFIFEEPRPGWIAHSAASKALKELKVLRALTSLGTDELYPALGKELDVLRETPGSEEPIESSWALANNATLPMFAELSVNHPARATNLASAMEALATMIPPAITTDNYDWASLPPSALIIDVGGGKGLACRGVAELHPTFRFIVQDLSDTVAAAKAQCPPSLLEGGRFKYMEHDFFAPQPALGADLFFFRAVMHDWPDKYCIKILQALIPGLKPGARVVIQDPHTPDVGEVCWWQDRQARGSNLRMKCFFNASDRESGEWEGLFKRADARFRIKGIKVHDREPGNSFGQLMVVVEAVWEG